MLKNFSFPAVSGLFLFCLGLVVILAWYYEWLVIISVTPGYVNMTFNTALCFMLSGLALILAENKSKYQNQIYFILGIFILAISGLTLLEYLLKLSLGIDQLIVKVWLVDDNPFPGRMAINTSFAFILTGLCFILFSFSDQLIIALFLQMAIFSLMLLAFSAFLGHVLNLEFLYSWYQYTRMAIYTSAGITILSIALWMSWIKSKNYFIFYQEHEDKKIILLSSMILISIASISSLSGFVIASNQIDKQIQLIITILAITFIGGVGLLSWQVLPLARQLMRAKKEALTSNLNLQAIFNNVAEGLITINAEGIVESLNPAACKMFGYISTEILGKNLEVLIPHGLREKYHSGMKRYLQTHDSNIIGKHQVEIPGLKKNGDQFLMEISITEMNINNQHKFIGIMHDISKRKAAEEELLESESRFRLAFDHSPVGMAIVSLAGRWLKVNKALCDIVGYSESELLQLDFQTITHPDDLKEDLDYAQQLYEGKIPFYRMEKRYIRKNKKITWILLTGSIIRNEKGAPLYYIAQIQDINEKKKTEEELSFKAHYDTLTGLVNRNQLEHILDFTISSALHHQNKIAILFIDLDHFKYINDTLGHDAGDELLKIMGDRLRKSIRKTDIAARLGGDEFIIILNAIDNSEIASIFAEKLLNNILEPIKIKEHELFITASIGISLYPSDGTDYQSLIKSADLALYKAKEQGRNTYQFCTSKMNEEIQEKSKFKYALQKAINQDEFYLTFLPRLDIKNRIVGFETLLRWKNKYYGKVSPAKIIPLAEEIGVIHQLSDWILETAILQNRAWQTEDFPVKLTINVSAKYYLQNDFTNTVFNILNKMQFSPCHLELEINESLIMHDPDYSIKVIRQFKNYGIQIIIDNFGVGYSSLDYLSQFGIDYIKIARDFVQDIFTNYQHHELINAIVVLAKQLNMKVIAQGVESIEQLNLLQQLGCDEFQGYFISPPLIANQIPKFLKTHRSGIIS